MQTNNGKTNHNEGIKVELRTHNGDIVVTNIADPCVERGVYVSYVIDSVSAVTRELITGLVSGTVQCTGVREFTHDEYIALPLVPLSKEQVADIGADIVGKAHTASTDRAQKILEDASAYTPYGDAVRGAASAVASICERIKDDARVSDVTFSVIAIAHCREAGAVERLGFIRAAVRRMDGVGGLSADELVKRCAAGRAAGKPFGIMAFAAAEEVHRYKFALDMSVASDDDLVQLVYYLQRLAHTNPRVDSAFTAVLKDQIERKGEELHKHLSSIFGKGARTDETKNKNNVFVVAPPSTTEQ